MSEMIAVQFSMWAQRTEFNVELHQAVKYTKSQRKKTVHLKIGLQSSEMPIYLVSGKRTP